MSQYNNDNDNDNRIGIIFMLRRNKPLATVGSVTHLLKKKIIIVGHKIEGICLICMIVELILG